VRARAPLEWVLLLYFIYRYPVPPSQTVPPLLETRSLLQPFLRLGVTGREFVGYVPEG